MVALNWTDVPEVADVPAGARRASRRRSAGEGPGLTVVRDAPPVASRREMRPGATSSRRRRIFFWRRVVVVAVIAGLGAAAWAAGGWLVQVAGAQPSVAPVRHVYVARPGDTVWGIAVRFSSGGDPRPLVDKLEAQIGGGVLQPGEQLTVP
jgi:hypothetical protein